MAAEHCIDRERLAAWCSGIEGEELEARRSELFWRFLNAQADAAVAAEIRQHVETCEACRGEIGRASCRERV